VPPKRRLTQVISADLSAPQELNLFPQSAPESHPQPDTSARNLRRPGMTPLAAIRPDTLGKPTGSIAQGQIAITALVLFP
jgi:hypothetical protein